MIILPSSYLLSYYHSIIIIQASKPYQATSNQLSKEASNQEYAKLLPANATNDTPDTPTYVRYVLINVYIIVERQTFLL